MRQSTPSTIRTTSWTAAPSGAIARTMLAIENTDRASTKMSKLVKSGSPARAAMGCPPRWDSRRRADVTQEIPLGAADDTGQAGVLIPRERVLYRVLNAPCETRVMLSEAKHLGATEAPLRG